MPKTIFVCSTYSDLEDHRKLVLESMHALKQIVEAMEYWGAGPRETVATCLEKVKQSDILICIVGSRYGEVSREGKSIAQLEYETALKNGLEVFSYIIDEDSHPVLLKDVEFGFGAKLLSGFKSIVSSNMRGTFSSPEDLARKVTKDVICYLDEVGSNIQSALSSESLGKIPVWAGYTFGCMKSTVDLSSVLTRSHDYQSTSSDFSSHIIAAATVLESIKMSDYSFLDDLITFHQNTYDVIKLFISKIDFNEYDLANEILGCNDAFKIRMLIVLAELSCSNACVEAICIKAMSGNRYRNELREVDMPITPFYIVIRNALAVMGPSALPILEKYVNMATKNEKWQARNEFKRAIRRLRPSSMN